MFKIIQKLNSFGFLTKIAAFLMCLSTSFSQISAVEGIITESKDAICVVNLPDEIPPHLQEARRIEEAISNNDFNNIFVDYETNLMNAIADGDSVEKIASLINNGENVNAVFVYFLRAVNPVLRYAIDRGTDKESVEIIKILLDAGADASAITWNRMPNYQGLNKNLYGFMPVLSYAVIYSSPEIVKLLIESGTDVNCPCDIESYEMRIRRTPLYFALQLGKIEVANMLIDAGAEIEQISVEYADFQDFDIEYDDLEDLAS